MLNEMLQSNEFSEILVDCNKVKEIKITEDHPDMYSLRYKFDGEPKNTLSKYGGAFDLWTRTIHFDDDDILITVEGMYTHRITFVRKDNE
jgi:hypothetical protein